MRNFIPAVFLVLTLAACSENSNTSGADAGGDTSVPAMRTLGADEVDKSTFIGKDTANKMISSYLTSVGAPNNDTNLRSIIIDANALRDYLVTRDGKKITKMKLMFAHTQNYISAGNTGKNCGYKTGALTVILAGIDSAGNYVMYPGNQVMDNGLGCPPNFISGGTGANDLLTQ